MPRIRHITSYPAELFAIVREVSVDGKTVTLEFDDRLHANRWRGAFSVFLGVLRKSKDHEDLALNSYQVMSTITGEAPATLTFFPRDQSWFADVARKRVVADAPVVQPSQSLLDSLTSSKDQS